MVGDEVVTSTCSISLQGKPQNSFRNVQIFINFQTSDFFPFSLLFYLRPKNTLVAAGIYIEKI